MTTRITRSPATAAKFIRDGGLAAFPTETVYGLGADAFNEKAIRKIFTAKGRPSDNPLIIHVAETSQIELLAKSMPSSAKKFIRAFFPGPLTIILPKRKEVSDLITAGLPTVGVRMPSFSITRRFLRECRTPVVAPSANRSGKPSPTTWQAVKDDLDGKIECILTGAQTSVGLESTVVDCTGRIPEILRAGAITLEELRAIDPSTRVASNLKSRPARSPGLKYRHYAPRARIVLVQSPHVVRYFNAAAYIGMTEPSSKQHFKKIKICSDIRSYAHSLFLFFRQCDQMNVKTIYCQSISEAGLGLALMDRIRRAMRQ